MLTDLKAEFRSGSFVKDSFVSTCAYVGPTGFFQPWAANDTLVRNDTYKAQIERSLLLYPEFTLIFNSVSHNLSANISTVITNTNATTSSNNTRFFTAFLPEYTMYDLYARPSFNDCLVRCSQLHDCQGVYVHEQSTSTSLRCYGLRLLGPRKGVPVTGKTSWSFAKKVVYI